MTQICDVAIIGAGPHGLSLAAHLQRVASTIASSAGR